jgi:hypothetical protein
LLFESDDTDIDRWHALVGELIDAGADSSV